MVIRLKGPNWWGLGHAIPAIIEFHHLCRLLQRFCYISMYDMSLGKLFGYGNGMSWDPDPAELEQYGANVSVRCWPLFTAFLEQARALDNYSLIEVVSHRPVTTATFERRFHYDRLPLPPSKSLTMMPHVALLFKDPNRHRLYVQSPMWLTRCFARFVTYERFECERTVPRTVYHLRTGFADVRSEVLSAQRGQPRNFTAIEEWLRLACPTLHLQPRVLVVTDSPGIKAHYQAKSGEYLGDEELRASATPTRSWSNPKDLIPFDVQLKVVQDICTASGAEELYHDSKSSFPQPLISRSMCIKEHHEFRSMDTRTRCRNWESVFPRDMYLSSLYPRRYNMTQQHNLTPLHPCYQKSASTCRQLFLQATS